MKALIGFGGIFFFFLLGCLGFWIGWKSWREKAVRIRNMIVYREKDPGLYYFGLFGYFFAGVGMFFITFVFVQVVLFSFK